MLVLPSNSSLNVVGTVVFSRLCSAILLLFHLFKSLFGCGQSPLLRPEGKSLSRQAGSSSLEDMHDIDIDMVMIIALSVCHSLDHLCSSLRYRHVYCDLAYSV